MTEKKIEWISCTQEAQTPSLTKQKLLNKKKIYSYIIFGIATTIVQYTLFTSCTNLSLNSDQKSHKNAIIVAKNSILKGDTLTENNTKLVYLDIGENKQEFILNSEFKKFIDHQLKISINANTPILKALVSVNQQNLSLPEKIPPGKRFYTLDIDLKSMASLLKVGDLVDVIAHMDINGFGNATETILNKIKIIGIGNNFTENSSDPEANTLSFYLSSEEVKIISFMKSYSQFTVALRNPNDMSSLDNDPITFNKFLQNEKIQKIFQGDSFKIIEGKKR